MVPPWAATARLRAPPRCMGSRPMARAMGCWVWAGADLPAAAEEDDEDGVVPRARSWSEHGR
jgi:hypothetical protein